MRLAVRLSTVRASRSRPAYTPRAPGIAPTRSITRAIASRSSPRTRTSPGMCGHRRVVEQAGADVVERADHRRARQDPLRLLGGGPVRDVERVGAVLVEAERVHAVDDDLARRARRRARRAGRRAPRTGRRRRRARPWRPPRWPRRRRSRRRPAPRRPAGPGRRRGCRAAPRARPSRSAGPGRVPADPSRPGSRSSRDAHGRRADGVGGHGTDGSQGPRPLARSDPARSRSVRPRAEAGAHE